MVREVVMKRLSPDILTRCTDGSAGYASFDGTVEGTLVGGLHVGTGHAKTRQGLGNHFLDLFTELLHHRAVQRDVQAFFVRRINLDHDVAGLQGPSECFVDCHIMKFYY